MRHGRMRHWKMRLVSILEILFESLHIPIATMGLGFENLFESSDVPSFRAGALRLEWA